MNFKHTPHQLKRYLYSVVWPLNVCSNYFFHSPADRHDILLAAFSQTVMRLRRSCF